MDLQSCFPISVLIRGMSLFDGIRAIDYVALQKSTDLSDPRALGFYAKTSLMSEITAEALDDVFSGFEEHPERDLRIFSHGFYTNDHFAESQELIDAQLPRQLQTAGAAQEQPEYEHAADGLRR